MLLRHIIGRLRANAAVFEALCRNVADEQARWRPSADKWSMLEVMSHLADEEVEDFRTRVDLTLSWIIVTPHMHKFHHHFERPWTDTNFGNIFSFKHRAHYWNLLRELN